MKIVCDNCATKYSIADEKVRGKVFKIRCKKCSHIIVVKGVEGEGGAVDAAAPDAPAADTGDAGAGADGWHVVINGEQVGPLSPADVRAKFSGGEIDAETFAWKEGFGDWQRLASIDEFADLAVPAPSAADTTRRTGADDLFGGGEQTQAGGDLFGGSPGPGNDLFAGSAGAGQSGSGGGGGAGLFAAPAAAAPEPPRRSPTPGFGARALDDAGGGAAPAQRADAGKLTGQRNENSVLFSLNNLQALASGGPAKSGGGNNNNAAPAGNENRAGFANSQTEGSGLIDIRAMAAATLSSPQPQNNNNNDLPSFASAPVFSPIAAPILMPSAASGPPKWVYPVVGAAGLAFVGIVILAFVVLSKKPDQVAMAPVAPVAAPVAGAPAAVAPTAAQPGAALPTAAPTAPAAGTPAAPTAAATPAPHVARTAKTPKVPSAAGPKSSKPDATTAAPEPAAAPAPAAPKKKSKGSDDLDDLLNGATAKEKPAREDRAAAAASSDENLPEQLDKGAIVAGMAKVKGKVSACYDQFKVPGLANVSVTIVKSGHVSNAAVSGAFAGTPTGDCVQKAVKSASFSQFKGGAQTIAYPFMLR